LADGRTGQAYADAEGRGIVGAALADAHANNFDALRLVFATMVVVYHLALLPGLPAWRPVADLLAHAAGIGVQGFFVLSGYLVFGSLRRSASPWVYAEKRVRRLYPAYAVVVLACAVAALATSPAARADLAGVASYLGWNLVFLNFMAPDLPGVFADNPVTAVNGALWTIKIEVMFYIILPAIAFLLTRGPRTRWLVIAGLYVLAEAWRLGFGAAVGQGGDPVLASIAMQLPGQLSFFMAGVAAHFLPKAGFQNPLVFLLAATALAASFLTPWLEPLRAASLAWVSLAVALGLRRVVDAARFGDLSYGVYITHFPLIQGLVAAGMFASAPLTWAGLALGLVIAASLVLWWTVERPALRSDSAYRRA
jgi:peptidoglycan/LPS O-acetylase OafA/YrhL